MRLYKASWVEEMGKKIKKKIKFRIKKIQGTTNSKETVWENGKVGITWRPHMN